MDAIVVNNAIHNLSVALRDQDKARLRKARSSRSSPCRPTTSTPCSVR